MFRKSLQTITWGDPQHDRFDSIFELAARSGFDGLEIGFRRLRNIAAQDMRRLLEKHGLVINASHIGGNLTDSGQAAGERGDVDAALEYLQALGVPYLLYSGAPEPDDARLDSMIGQLNALAERCAGLGIQLLYHNHDWEFADGRRIWRRIRAQGSPALGYAPDLGWAAMAGEDLTSLLDELGAAARILHFKDFVSAEPGPNTGHLGEGIIDFSPAWHWLKDKEDRDIWLTAEQDNAEDADRACRINGAFLQAGLKRLGSGAC